MNKKAFSNIRIIDTTHVLAGPFASYQMATLGAEVIKVEAPQDPDQARMQGSDRGLSDSRMGTAFMAQASNKKALALDLKTPDGQQALKKLIKTADVFVENYRPGSFEALGLGYKELSSINPALIYCSISAFGATGPRRNQTGYDNIVQAFSGMMAMTGFTQGQALKSGAPVVDYATGTMAAFAISAALFQRERSDGKGQFIDVSMLDVALMLSSSHLTGYLWNGSHPEPKGNRFPFATIGGYEAADAPMMIAASNLQQQKNLWQALGREDMVKTDNNQRLDAHAEESAVLAEIIKSKPADYWEDFFRSRRIPAARIRRLQETLADEQIQTRNLFHTHHLPGNELDGLTVPVSAIRMSESMPGLDFPPQPVGAQTAEILESIGYTAEQLEALRATGVIN